ncbi:hypothetical protein L6452_06139 [Arctium lappa]|uniref:Uncharacterized protein n=1 Tax=Arctium lappa TaxID=4217 RepID=A0ACB9EIA1_ARCLA|nr:hypothetical protein L6452_06139 [Arctium lappa]
MDFATVMGNKDTTSLQFSRLRIRFNLADKSVEADCRGTEGSGLEGVEAPTDVVGVKDANVVKPLKGILKTTNRFNALSGSEGNGGGEDKHGRKKIAADKQKGGTEKHAGLEEGPLKNKG